MEGAGATRLLATETKAAAPRLETFSHETNGGTLDFKVPLDVDGSSELEEFLKPHAHPHSSAADHRRRVERRVAICRASFVVASVLVLCCCSLAWLQRSDALSPQWCARIHNPELCLRALRCHCSRGIAWPCTPTVCSARSCPGCSHTGSSSLVSTHQHSGGCLPTVGPVRARVLCTRHTLRCTPLASSWGTSPVSTRYTRAPHTHTHTHTRACGVLSLPPWRKK